MSSMIKYALTAHTFNVAWIGAGAVLQINLYVWTRFPLHTTSPISLTTFISALAPKEYFAFNSQ